MNALQTPAMDAPAGEWGRLALSIPGWRTPWEDLPASWLATEDGLVPDPDHWAWEGWMLRMLGPGWCWQQTDDGCIVSRHLISGFTLGVWDRNAYRAPTLGRAAIAAAAAPGRWPGGAE